MHYSVLTPTKTLTQCTSRLQTIILCALWLQKRSKKKHLKIFILNTDILLLPPANEVWGKIMFLHLSDNHSVHGVGGCTSGSGGVRPWVLGCAHAPREPPTANKRAVRILLECFLVRIHFGPQEHSVTCTRKYPSIFLISPIDILNFG